MSLQLGNNFPQRWLAAPYSERRQVLRELSSICLLLEPETRFEDWEKDQLQPDDLDIAPTISTASAVTPDSSTTQTQRLLSPLEEQLQEQANAMIERALDPLRQELRRWLDTQIQYHLQAYEDTATR